MADISLQDSNDQQVLFPKLNQAEIRHRSEAERRLPKWLSMPIQFSATNLADLAQDIEEFADHIDQDLINHLKVNLNIKHFFPVQSCLVPALTKQFKLTFLKKSDFCISSPTGSGKTLAYVIPIVNHLKQTLARRLRCIALLPTHDLAQQVFKVFSQVCQPTHLRCAIANGGPQDCFFFKRAPNYNNENDPHRSSRHVSSLILSGGLDGLQTEEYVSTIDILVTTPGLLIDLIQNQPGFSLQHLEMLVIDEADRLMANHKHDWLNALERSLCRSFECPSSIHKLLFSATLSSDPQILLQMNLFQPRLFLATKPSLTGIKIRNSLGSHASTPAGSPLSFPKASVLTTVSTKSELLATTAIPEQLEEKMFITEMKDKLQVMWYLMHEKKCKRVLCFVNDRKRGFELCSFLNEIAGVRAVNFSSDVKAEVRVKCLNEFRKGTIDIIVATDLLGRGMDIEGVDYVISYDMPQSGTWYAHRVGRTARAGKKGTAITLVDSRQLVQFKKIVQMAHKLPNSMKLSHVIEEMKVPHFERKDERRDLYIKTYENYVDKLKLIKEKHAHYKNKK